MTGLKRLLLIIFSLHNIKHHIISQEGEGRAIVLEYIRRGEKWIRPEDILRGISWSEAEPPTMTMDTIRPFIHEHSRVLFHRSSHQTNNFPSYPLRGRSSVPRPRHLGCWPWIMTTGSQVRANINTWAVIVYGPRPPLTCGQPPGTDMSLSVWPSLIISLWSLTTTSNN